MTTNLKFLLGSFLFSIVFWCLSASASLGIARTSSPTENEAVGQFYMDSLNTEFPDLNLSAKPGSNLNSVVEELRQLDLILHGGTAEDATVEDSPSRFIHLSCSCRPAGPPQESCTSSCVVMAVLLRTGGPLHPSGVRN